MPAPGMDALKRIEQARKAMGIALEAAARAYANGGPGGPAAPIVDDRFKGGGNARFRPLSPEYAREKLAAAPKLRAGMKAAGRVVPKGKASGPLPILVRTGKLRERVSNGRAHRIAMSADGLTATITFINLPLYADYHHRGKGRLPKRSPVRPNAADLAKVRAVFVRTLKARMALLSRSVPQPSDLAKNSTPRGVGNGST